MDLCNGIVKEGCIPEDWKSSVVLPIYKGKKGKGSNGVWITHARARTHARTHAHTHTHTQLIAVLWPSWILCGFSRGIKLLEHAMKVVEWIFEHRIRQPIDMMMQFGFIKGKGTTDGIFIARQMQEK